jgi:hypothetical protein
MPGGVPGRDADSAGRPWAGRSFHHHDTTYAADDGSAPAGYLEAVRALAEGSGSRAAVVEALRGERVLVPLLAAAGETGVDERGRTIDKTQELSIVTVQGPDGAPILPMFSHVQAMQSWNAAARPVPSSVQRAAAAALDGPARIVLDPGSASEFVLGRTMLEAMLADAPWSWGAEDPAVHEAVLDALFAQPAVEAVVLATGDPLCRLAGADLEVHALVDDSMHAAEQISRAAGALGEAEVLRERIESLALRVHRWDGGASPLPLSAAPIAAVTRAERASR